MTILTIPYVTNVDFALLSTMPREDIEQLFDADAGWLKAQLTSASRRIDGRLAKRYAVPFVVPVPELVKYWVVRIVTPIAYLRRGVAPRDDQYVNIREDGEQAWKEVGEAADAKDGMFELPLRSDTTTSGISKGAPLGSADASPYAWTDTQYEAVYGS
jgi:phage gp36-like protein